MLHLLHVLAIGLTLILGVAGLAWLVAEVSVRAVDATCRAFHVHRYFCQFVYERHRERLRAHSRKQLNEVFAEQADAQD